MENRTSLFDGWKRKWHTTAKIRVRRKSRKILKPNLLRSNLIFELSKMKLVENTKVDSNTCKSASS